MPKLPKEFIDKYRKLLGTEKSEQLFNAIKQPERKAFRINSLKELKSIRYSTSNPVLSISNAYYGQISGQDPEWVSGTVYSQDPAAMFPAVITQAQPGQRILDLCAAPGGKSTALGEQLAGKGVLVANEISNSRARILRENIERWGITNSLITNDSPEKLATQFPVFFDKILVDAPCSGEGMFRKNIAATEYWSQDYVLVCQNRQKKILTEAIKMLKAGGELIYSTCTFAPEENEQVVSWLMDVYGFKILPIELSNSSVDHGHPDWSNGNTDLKNALRFWPYDNLGEGQFVAKLVKPKETTIASSSKKVRFNKKKSGNNSLLRQQTLFVSEILNQFELPKSISDWKKSACVSHDHVFIPAIKKQDLHTKILDNGIELGVLKKNRFEPSHHLAMVLGQIEQTRVLNLTDEEFASYLHGETLPVKSHLKGFVLVSCRDFIFSFGKITGNGILKNFYPKGLRTLKKD